MLEGHQPIANVTLEPLDDFIVIEPLDESELPSGLIVPANGSPRIEDMISEGVSMRITQRNDYESFLNGNGGNIAALIRGLQQKADQLAAAA